MVTSVHQLANRVAEEHPGVYMTDSLHSDSAAEEEHVEFLFSQFLSARLHAILEQHCLCDPTAYVNAALSNYFSRKFCNRDPPSSPSSMTAFDRNVPQGFNRNMGPSSSMNAPAAFNTQDNNNSIDNELPPLIPPIMETLTDEKEERGCMTPEDDQEVFSRIISDETSASRRVEVELICLQELHTKLNPTPGIFILI
jgi:hypothetical protein